MRYVLLAALALCCLDAQAGQPDYRTEMTPIVRQAMDRQLYVARGEERQASRRRWRRAWIASWAAFAAANVLDARSSAGKREANPLLRRADGTFASGRATAIKLGAGGGLLALQGWLIRKNRDRNLYKGFTAVNVAAAGGLGAVAAVNSTK